MVWKMIVAVRIADSGTFVSSGVKEAAAVSPAGEPFIKAHLPHPEMVPTSE